LKTQQKLVLQLTRLNQRLSEINTRTNYFVYQGNFLKFAFYNFLAGVFHSLGTLFGTAIIASLIIYILSQIGFIQPLLQNLPALLPPLPTGTVTNPF
jgi:hypothetical protein